MFQVELSQEKHAYWRRPCWRGWPCLWTQHRGNIDEMMERMVPQQKNLERDCRLEMQLKLVNQAKEGVFGRGSKISSENRNSAEQSTIAAGGDVNVNFSFPEIREV